MHPHVIRARITLRLCFILFFLECPMKPLVTSFSTNVISTKKQHYHRQRVQIRKPPSSRDVLSSVYGWDDRIRQLESFYAEHGHTRVLAHHDAEDKRYRGLHQWVRTIRMFRERLSPDRVKRLEDMGFLWQVRRTLWDANYARLREFHQKHGHCRVPTHSLQYPGLGRWVQNQRKCYRCWKMGKHSSLSSERRRALKILRFEWYQDQSTTWDQHYQHLRNYVQEHGHASVPQNYPSLGDWCMNQRSAYRRYLAGQSSTLTPHRIQRLNDAHFVWDARTHKWKVMVERLGAFHKLHNHTNIPKSDPSLDDLRLWTIRQRHSYNGGRLPPERMADLRPLASDWKRHRPTADWAKLFDAMRQKGIQPGVSTKKHWFDGSDRFSDTPYKETWTEKDLLDLWNQESDDDDEY